jgi:N-methylhydantoinase A
VSQYRIGIDVGGTFTHAVALEATTFELAAQTKVPTTHQAARGVSEGVVEALRVLLSTSGLAAADVMFVAYSTTQITNALLEGDVAPVGIVALGAGVEGRRAQAEAKVGDVELAPGKLLHTFHAPLDAEAGEEMARVAIAQLRDAGAQAIVAAEAFSVDDPARELRVMEAARALDLPATGTHEVSGRYGLRARTRTAVINASLLPRTIATADMTEQAVRESGIAAPLMVVRSDGGVMSVTDLRRRPLLSLLSGPAAGVAAALMYVRVSDGVFLEVGGTSTDITAIQQGRALVRTAEVGSHRLFLSTLDVRTIGVAGGSMPRLRGGAIADVGPRSAHLAGLPYAAFTDPGDLRGPSLLQLSPRPGDPDDYVAVETAAGRRVAVTVTDAANAVGRVPEGDWSKGNEESARLALGALGQRVGGSVDGAAEAMLAAAAEKAARTVQELMAARGMDPELTELIGGGGGAGALVPAAAARLGLPFRIAPNNAVVSAIGTALAFVREVVERTVPNATDADLLRVRREAAEAVIRGGADPDTVTVEVEYDARSAVLRAAATGQVELRARDLAQAAASDEERRAAAAKSLRTAADQVESVADTALLRAYRATRQRRRLFGLVTHRETAVALVDHHGITRLVLRDAALRAARAAEGRAAVAAVLEELTTYGDAGAELPQLFLGLRARVVNLSGLISAEQVLSLAEAELAGLAPEEQMLVLGARR